MFIPLSFLLGVTRISDKKYAILGLIPKSTQRSNTPCYSFLFVLKSNVYE